MRNEILNVTEFKAEKFFIQSAISLKPFLHFLESRSREEKTVKKKLYQLILEKFNKHPEFQENLTPEAAAAHPELLEMIYAVLVPAIDDEQKTYWALSQPMAPIIFYGTEAMYDLIMDGETHMIKKAIMKPNTADKEKNHLSFVYSFILQKLYNINFVIKDKLIHSMMDEEAGVMKYYQMNFDSRFIQVKCNRELPDIKIENIHNNFQEIDFELLQKELPLDTFSFEGIAVLTLHDVTAAYALELIKDNLLTFNTEQSKFDYGAIESAMKTLAGSKDIEFGILPKLKVNNKLVFHEETCTNSLLIEKAGEHGLDEEAYMSLAEKYFANPKPLYIQDLTHEIAGKEFFLKILRENGVKSYALLPIYYNNEVAGVLEIYATRDGLLNEGLFSKFDAAVPLLAQLLKNNIEYFESKLETIIKDKFTTIQHAVQWKFNEAAWHYMRDEMRSEKKARMEQIVFEKVYPLYGAIDIRNSSAERANAILGDMQARLELLINTLTELKKHTPLPLVDEKIFMAKKWEQGLTDFSVAANEVALNYFLELEMTDFLNHFSHHTPQATQVIESYKTAVADEKGLAHRNRTELEGSMLMITTSVNDYLEKEKDVVLSSYPSYFEKFRSDGIEYDIYIGQSIAPERPFNLLYYHNLRLWQLSSMAEIARRTHQLIPDMKRPLQTTQLIFIHPDPIAINFRTDERRFDVEGAYNIRYQMIKKRIDKVRINKTNERLTQPGKIALVYFNDGDAAEYQKYIQFLQNQGSLLNDVEELELENLQGVAGLKALRVGINLDHNKPIKSELSKSEDLLRSMN